MKPIRFIHDPIKNIKWYANNSQFYFILLSLLHIKGEMDKKEGMDRVRLTAIMFLASKMGILGEDFKECQLWEMRDHVFHCLLNLGVSPLNDFELMDSYIPYPKEFYDMWK